MPNQEDVIRIRGASENNLKNIDVDIPKDKIVVFTGVSGSGKSSLAFDTIAVESSREWQASYPLFLRNRMPHYERPKVDFIENLTPAVVVDQRTLGSSSRSNVGTAVDAAPLLRLLFSRIGVPSAGGSMAYSFNHPLGMCPDCTGLGERLTLDEDSLFDENKTLREGAICFSQFAAGWQADLYVTNQYLDPDKKLRDFSPEEWEILRNGTPEKTEIEIRSNKTGRVDYVDYEGVLPRFRRLYLNRDISKLKKSLQDEIMTHVHKGPCTSCHGTGLNAKALASKINGYNIVDYQNLSVSELLPLLEAIQSPMGISLARQLSYTLERMVNLGIGYLSLGRPTDTLSGGERQRLKLVRHLGNSLNNITYILDEPTAGLHPADAQRIGHLLLQLRDQHNNVLIVEHHRQMIELADQVIELGPLAGSHGGQIVYQGDVAGLKQAGTLTGQAIFHKIQINRQPKPWSEAFLVENATLHNLKNLTVKIPQGVFTAVTGVAGSGKTSLVCGEFASRYPEAIVIDQKPIGTSIRSTPATYTGIMDQIRKLFAKENNVPASWFSSNSKGACPVCHGKGKITYDMAFADAVEEVCEECGRHRFNPTALSYQFQGRNIENIMDLTIEQAMDFFQDKKIRTSLQSLLDVGLGYLTLGQPTSTLSGGEVQRVKLASELQKKGNIYILDEPTTGLHNRDVETLYALLRKLVDNHNTVVIVDHRLELIAQADWVIDMGPEGGTRGGEILFQGTPEQLLSCTNSKTGHFLKSMSQ